MSSRKQDERGEFERAKRASLAQVLFKSARLLNEQALARIREQTGKPIRPAHTTLFPHLDLEGTRLTDLARRVGISKQAVGQLVGDLEAMGWLERVPDPEDGRAKLVRFTRRRGKSSAMDGLALLGDMESELRRELGAESFDQLADLLGRLLDLLERREA
jgi:DNA-binding MarR family transcriptional regulator